MNLPDFRLLQAAIVLSEDLNFSRAAERLHIVQPTLSKQILELETQLGFQLFIRSSQSVVMTEACYSFVEEAREVLFHGERAVNLARAASHGAQSVINVGRSPYVDPYFVSVLSTVSLPLFPGVRLNLGSMLAPELEQRLLIGKLDLAIITGASETPKLLRTEIATSPFYVAMSVEDELAHKHGIRLKDFNQRDCVLFERSVHPLQYEKVLSRAEHEHVHFAEVQHVMTAEEAAYLLQDGRKLALLTRTGAWRIADRGLTIRPLLDEQLRLSTYLVIRSGNESRLLRDLIRGFVKRLASNKASSQLKLKLAS